MHLLKTEVIQWGIRVFEGRLPRVIKYLVLSDCSEQRVGAVC